MSGKGNKLVEDRFLKAFGLNVKKYRKKKAISMEELGLEIGLTRMHIYRIEKGYNVTLKSILKIAAALEIQPDKLLKIPFTIKKDDLE